MAGVSNRSGRWRWTALAAALVVLDASLTFNNLWPTPGVSWSGELSVELAVCVLAMAFGSRWFGPPSRPMLGLVAPLTTVVAHWVTTPLFNLYFGMPTVKSQGLAESAPARGVVGPRYSTPLMLPLPVEVVTSRSRRLR